MKFSSTLITIIAVLSTLSWNVEGRIVKRADTNTAISAEDLKNCEAGIKEYEECTKYKEKITKDNIDNYCKVFNNEKCQKLYAQGLQIVPACAKLPKASVESTQRKFDTINYTFKLLCAKDEKGKFCPLSEVYITQGNSGFDNNGFDNSLKDTCNSKKCVDAAIEAFTILETSGLANQKSTNTTASNTTSKTTSKTTSNANGNVKREMVKGGDAVSAIIKNLKADNCTAQAKASEKSDATTLSIGNTLFLALALLLLVLNN